MELECYKICPSCGAHNPQTAIDCEQCGVDIFNEQVVHAQMERIVPVVTPAALVRYCDCGAKNPPQARICVVCGEDISDVLPTEECTCGEHIMLTNLDGSCALVIVEAETVIGREAALYDYLVDKPFVSRRHAKLYKSKDVLEIENLSTTNPTFINNVKSENGKRYRLQDGDEIGLGGLCIAGKRQEQAAYFLVRIGPCM